MARDILKVRKVGGTLVVTLTQTVLEQISLAEGDRVLIEALPPRRILISKEQPMMPSTRRVELEIGLLQAELDALNFKNDLIFTQHRLSLPCAEAGLDEPDNLMLWFKMSDSKRAEIAQKLAQKRLELFDLAGGV